MYFPYVRGRQYELLALRELAEKRLIGENVLPIIEPVKLTATLYKTVDAWIERSMKLGIVCNPTVGSLLPNCDEESGITNKEEFFKKVTSPSIQKVLLMQSDVEEQLRIWENEGVHKKDWIIVSEDRDEIENYRNLFSGEVPKVTLVPDEFRRKISKNRVLFEDRFNKKLKNADYLDKEDEFFSEDHLYYQEEGFKGFADYSVIGKDYVEAGFAPRAVAIHIVYFGADKTLRVKHFVSDSNAGIENPAGKFYEAVTKLNKWVEETEPKMTEGLKCLCNHYKEGTYPGLGSLKKMSLMHHLELMSVYLDEVAQR